MYQCLTPAGAFEIYIIIENDYLFKYKHYGRPYFTLLFIASMQIVKYLKLWMS